MKILLLLLPLAVILILIGAHLSDIGGHDNLGEALLVIGGLTLGTCVFISILNYLDGKYD